MLVFSVVLLCARHTLAPPNKHLSLETATLRSVTGWGALGNPKDRRGLRRVLEVPMKGFNPRTIVPIVINPQGFPSFLKSRLLGYVTV